MPKKKVETDETKQEEKKVDLTKIKGELTSYIDKLIDDTFLKRIDNANRLLIREKNKTILSKNILITFLLLVIVALLFIMNSEGYFTKYFMTPIEQRGENTTNKDNNIDTEPAPVTGPTLDELIETYSPLLNKITISENSKYLKDYYSNNLSNELKLYLALNNIDFSKITNEDDYSEISIDLLKESYEKLFNTEFDSVNFNYNNNKLRYINKLDSYLSDNVLEKEKTNIKREIIDIKTNDKEVNIITIEGLVKDNKLYNILSDEEVSNNLDLSANKDKLNKVTYTFKDSKLISIK